MILTRKYTGSAASEATFKGAAGIYFKEVTGEIVFWCLGGRID